MVEVVVEAVDIHDIEVVAGDQLVITMVFLRPSLELDSPLDQAMMKFVANTSRQR